jgi:hypothetical protein
MIGCEEARGPVVCEFARLQRTAHSFYAGKNGSEDLGTASLPPVLSIWTCDSLAFTFSFANLSRGSVAIVRQSPVVTRPLRALTSQPISIRVLSPSSATCL